MTDPIKKRKKKKHNKKKRVSNISSALLKKLLSQTNLNNPYKNSMYNPQGITYYGGLSGGSIPINNSVLNKPAYEFGSLTERLARPAILPAPVASSQPRGKAEPVLQPLKPVVASSLKPPVKSTKMKFPLGAKPPSRQNMKDFLASKGIKTKSNATSNELHALMKGYHKFKNPDKPKNAPMTDIFTDPVKEESKKGFSDYDDNSFGDDVKSDVSDLSTHISYKSAQSIPDNASFKSAQSVPIVVQKPTASSLVGLQPTASSLVGSQPKRKYTRRATKGTQI